ncbi:MULTISPECIES: hypothetical protein [unclassified Massilia]|nr:MULTISPECIES: hypothetical protein [unclassified Massilia]
MDNFTTLLRMLTSISDPTTLVFLAAIAALGVVGLALYVVALALKQGRRS